MKVWKVYCMHAVPYNMVKFCILAAEIASVVWVTRANFNRFRVLAALLHGTLALDVSETLRCLTEGATYITPCSHHVAHWPTFLVHVWFGLNFCMIITIGCNKVDLTSASNLSMNRTDFHFCCCCAAGCGTVWSVRSKEQVNNVNLTSYLVFVHSTNVPHNIL